MTFDEVDYSVNNRYRNLNNKMIIDLKLSTPNQLFDERDPSPFREKDLCDDAVAYIVDSLRDLSNRKSIKLSLIFNDLKEFKDSPEILERAIRSHFVYERAVKSQMLRWKFRNGFISLLIGLSFLFLCISLSKFLHRESIVSNFIVEGLTVLGWVSMWHPINIFLYEWWPIREQQDLLRIAAQMEIEISENNMHQN